MSVPYKNPISSVQVSTPQSVSRTSVFGTNFSVLNVGGYMEVYNLSDLSLTLTASTYPSLIQLSANTIPIRFTKGNNTFLSPDYLTLNSDNISSGRRRLGMMVYVHETDKVYQYVIPNYDTLWNNMSGLTGFSAITYSDYTTVVNNRSSAGQSFIQSWTASTIEGVGGYTSVNANWRIFQTGGSFTGGTVSGATNFTGGLSANTISATTITVNNISGTTRLVGLQTFQGTTDSDAAPLGPELTTTGTSDSSWTGTSFASGYTHIPGSTTTLVSPLTAITGTYYYILATISGRTAGDITIDFGGYSNGSLTGATIYYAPLATTTGALTVTPTIDFDGTITVSVKTIGTSLPSTKFINSLGGTSIEIRADKNGNTFIGNNSGRRNFGFNNNGIYNTFVGQSAGRNNTSGRFNTFIGMETGINNNIGFSNTFIGNGAGYSNTYGNSNTFIGHQAGTNTTTANSNTALGSGALYVNTTGIQNTAIGQSSLNALLNSNTNTAVGYFTGLNLTAGTDNILLGSGAARYISGGVTKATNIGNSIIIGSNTYPLGDSQTNQIVIGYQSIGLGSNTTVLGNSSTLKTAIYGNLLLGTTSDNGARLQVYGNTFISSGLTANTISATTYFNLPTDIRVTGGTYNTGSSSITFTNNTGGTFNVTGITSSGGGSFTGGTVSGATNFTGGLTANTISTSGVTMNNDLTVGTGFTILTKLSILNAVDDTAAAALGVPLYGLYRNGNAVQIRLM